MTAAGKPDTAGGGIHQEATASGSAVVNQAARDLHVHYGPGVRRVVPGQDGLDGGCPYPGLAAFTADQSGVFFGRDRLAAELLVRLDVCLAEGSPLMVVAPSGAGKTSLLQAGLLHKIAEGGLAPDGSRHWPRVQLTPGAHPMRQVSSALLAALPVTVAAPTERNRAEWDPSPDDLDRLLARVMEADGSRGRAVIVVDQFEELFLLCDDEAARATFVSWLWRAAGHGDPSTARAVVACGLRADFYGECARYSLLREALQQHQVLLRSMSAGELREAICGPAQAVSLEVEPGLVELLLRDLRPGQAAAAARRDDLADYDAGRLPLLGHALRATWQLRQGSTLTLEGYKATGGIDHAIAETAERVFRGLDTSSRHEARALFLRLVKIGSSSSEDVRRPLGHAGLASASASTVATADAYTAARLLTRTRDAVQITHEALLGSWPRLRSWLDEDRAGNLVRQDIEDAAADWDHAQGDSSRLYRGARLETTSIWAVGHGQELSRTAQRFLAASREHAHRAKTIRRSAIAALVALALVTSITSVVASQQRAIATRQRDLAISNQLIADANQLGPADASLAYQLLNQAYRVHPRPDVASRLIGSENQALAMPIPMAGTNADSIAFSPNGHMLAIGSDADDGKVGLWDIADSVRARPLGRPLPAGPGFHVSVAFSPDGRILASSSSGLRHSVVKLWNIADPGWPRSRMLGHALVVGPGSSVAFNSDGRILAIGSAPGVVRLWDISDPARPRPLGHPLVAGPGVGSASVAFSRDGRILAIGVADSTVTLWAIADPAHPRPLGHLAAGHAPAGIALVAFKSHGHILATDSGFNPSTIRLWDIGNPARPRQLGKPLAVGLALDPVSMVFSRDGRTLAASNSDGQVKMWDVADAVRPRQLGQPLVADPSGSGAVSIAFSPDSDVLASGETSYPGTGNGVAQLWSLPPTVLTSVNGQPVDSLAFSPQGGLLAGAESTDDLVTLWDVANPVDPRPLTRLAAHGGFFGTLAFGPNGHVLATGSVSRTGHSAVILWNIAHPERPRQAGEPLSTGFVGNSTGPVAFSLDSHILIRGDDHGARLWGISDLARPRPLGRLHDKGGVDSVAFSPHGHILATGDGDGKVRLWDITDPARPRQLGQSMPAGHDALDSIAFSPVGSTLVSGNVDGTVTLWDTHHPSRLRRLGRLPAGDNVFSLAFSPHHPILAVADVDADTSQIRLWDLADPRRPRPLDRLDTAGAGESLAFSPRGSILASDDVNGAQLWNLNISYAINRVCRATALSRRQWHNYIPQLPYDPRCSA